MSYDIQDKLVEGIRRKVSGPTWKSNIRKAQRRAGEAYINMKGEITPRKQPLEVDCSNCKFRCNNKFSVENQIMICNQYWRLADVSRQYLFLCSLVEERAVKRHRREAISAKSKSRFYYLPCDSGELKRVCRRFLCATFSITKSVIQLALDKCNGGSSSVAPLNVDVRKVWD